MRLGPTMDESAGERAFAEHLPHAPNDEEFYAFYKRSCTAENPLRSFALT